MRHCKLLLGATILMAWLAPMALAQGESGTAGKESEVDPKRTTRLTLGSTSGTPGTSVVVPIYFTPAEGVRVGSLELIVDFISANLRFNRLDPGIAAEMGNVRMHAEVKQGKNDRGVETSTLTITASLPSSPPPEKGIPPGLLGYLTMRLDDDARPASITLRASAQASEMETDKPVQDLRAFDAKVDVLEAGSQPLIVCFFFTH